MRKYNGFGSIKQKILVRITHPYSESFSDTHSFEPVETSSEHSLFQLELVSTRRGDDETVIFELQSTILKEIPFDAWSVEWDRSTY